MSANVGMIDRVVRLVLGLILISQVFYGLQTPFGWLGAVLVATSVFSFCPVYRILGLRTNGS